MNLELLTIGGVTLFIGTPLVLIALGLRHLYWYSGVSYFKYFFAAMVLSSIGLFEGGKSTTYRYPTQKISDENFSLFYNTDLNYTFLSNSKQWDNTQGEIIVTKKRNVWGSEISESISVMPVNKQ